MRRISSFLFVGLFALFFGSRFAFGDIILPSLPAGTQYRLAFVSLSFTTANSTDIDDYNTWVRDDALAQPELTSLGTTWSAIASTPSISARANTGTDPTPIGNNGVPIYLLDGTTKIADHYDDLWDGTLDAAITVNVQGISTFGPAPWTGTNPDGTGFFGRELGTSSMRIGSNTATNDGWISFVNSGPAANRHLYGISGVLEAEAVPEPSALLCLGHLILAIQACYTL